MTIHMTASFEVKTIREFADDVRANEPDTILYMSLQEQENSTRFLHYFIFRDEKAREIHSSSKVVNRFTDMLYPNLVAPVEFTEYVVLTSTK